MNITLTPAVIAYLRATNTLDELMETGGDASAAIDARAAAKATLVADGFTPDMFDALADMF
ncbi:hypothetical protein [Nocardia rhizosphaerae]|uniref:Uncharacterized protein n=1 Tax=Nocardia rhizosphaerae TaxID=1691571 RepID=A0ABV8LES5_9NOCA